MIKSSPNLAQLLPTIQMFYNTTFISMQNINSKNSMEALWYLEDKLKLSTQEAVIFFASTVFLVIIFVGFCAATALRKRVTKNIHIAPVDIREAKGSLGQWVRVKSTGLKGSVMWSKASRWDQNLSASRKEQPTALLASGGGELGWPSHNAGSPVWQRPILMGEKCEFPRFSGLILYDERGKPLDQGHAVDITQEQPRITATLRDLL